MAPLGVNVKPGYEFNPRRGLFVALTLMLFIFGCAMVYKTLFVNNDIQYISKVKGVAQPYDCGARVNVSICYETFSPRTKMFFKSQLWPTYQNLYHRVNFDLVPYGTTEFHPELNETERCFTCREGPDQCVGNKLQACVVKLYEQNLSVPFARCIMISKNQYPLSAGKMCAKIVNLDWDRVENCCYGMQGVAYVHEMRRHTEGLSPQLAYAPQIYVNGQHSPQIQRRGKSSLMALVCTSMGISCNKPRVCTKYYWNVLL